MENRDRNQSRNDGPMDNRDDRDIESGRSENDSDVEFGRKIGESENPQSNTRDFPRRETEH